MEHASYFLGVIDDMNKNSVPNNLILASCDICNMNLYKDN